MNALIEKENVELLSGDINSFLFPDTCHTAYFCRVCATYIWSEYKSGRFDDCWFMRVGTLDEPDRFPPNVHIYTESMQPWLVTPSDVPGYKHFYTIEDVWKKCNIDRMRSSRSARITAGQEVSR